MVPPLSQQHTTGFLDVGILLLLLGRVSLCSPGWLGTHSVDLASLKITETLLRLPPRWLKDS